MSTEAETIALHVTEQAPFTDSKSPLPTTSNRGRSCLRSSTLVKRSSSMPPTGRRSKSRKIRKDGSPSNAPRDREDYQDYRFVLPSERSVNRQKLCLATQCELDAALALLDIKIGQKCTLHYDTTSRCGIDGEWVSLILSFNDGFRFRLRPIYLAYESRDNIIRYIVESYTSLAVLATNAREYNITVSQLWEQTTALMTDAVNKNLTIEAGVSKALNTVHVPLHLLCKSHTVEGLDRSNIQVLSEVEHIVKLREKLEAVNPAIKRFTRGEKSIVVAGIKSILNLISHAKSASPTNIAHLFDIIM